MDVTYHLIYSLISSLPYFGHKVVPHAQLWRDEFLPVGGPLCGNRRWGGGRLLYGASRNQHPHVESTPVSVNVLCWGLGGSRYREQRKEQMASFKHGNSESGKTQMCCRFVQRVKMHRGIVLIQNIEEEGKKCIHTQLRAQNAPHQLLNIKQWL